MLAPPGVAWRSGDACCCAFQQLSAPDVQVGNRHVVVTHHHQVREMVDAIPLCTEQGPPAYGHVCADPVFSVMSVCVCALDFQAWLLHPGGPGPGCDCQQLGQEQLGGV